MTSKALEFLKDGVAWEELHAIGQCIVLAEESGHPEIAERGADDFASLSRDFHRYSELHQIVNQLNESHQAIMKLVKKITGEEY